MPNYYQTNRYPRYVITSYVGECSSLERASGGLSADQVYAEFHGNLQGAMDLVFCFREELQKSIALGFRRILSIQGESEYMYSLAYLSPSLEESWRQVMNLVRDDYPYRVDDWQEFDIHRKGNEFRVVELQGQWKWAFYLRALVYVVAHRIVRWEDITDENWLLLSRLADQDVASLPRFEQSFEESGLKPILVPVTDEMQDAFDAYCALDIKNRVVPAYVEATARIRLWKANHPNWFCNIFASGEGVHRVS